MSDALTVTQDLFHGPNGGLDESRAARIVDDALHGADDGELFLEYRQSESLSWDDGRLRAANFDVSRGFGLRAVSGEAAACAHATEISEDGLKRAAETVRAVRTGQGGDVSVAPRRTNQALYAPDNPVDGVPFEAKAALLAEIDAYVRAADPRVHQVSVSLSAEWQAVRIFRAGGEKRADLRPLTRLNVAVTLEHEGRMEQGYHGLGGRENLTRVTAPETWRAAADEALRQAAVNMDSEPAPAGEMPVVLGPGWPGVMLHEAVGHGLEGDFNRKKTSAFAGLMGQRVAAPGVTVVDDGTMPDRRGSLTIDDEGQPTERTVLIEDGILKAYMQDRLNARLMGQAPTGNGRRESFAHAPMPRMTNTVMLGGGHAPGEIIASVKDGLYAVNFGGGQVDITSGKFVFTCTEAYRIEGGRIGRPVKGATLIGDGPSALTRVMMVGDDMALDSGVGVCGKNGQGVPVGVGQPTLRIDGLTVGGTG
ncbi:MAG: metalloprotease TldD [Rhodospirillales bacterium]